MYITNARVQRPPVHLGRDRRLHGPVRRGQQPERSRVNGGGGEQADVGLAEAQSGGRLGQPPPGARASKRE